MALPAVAGATIYAADLYGLCQPSGGHEYTKYFLSGWANAANNQISQYMRTVSTGATPVSVTTDTTDQAATNVNAPSNNHLTQYGVQMYTTSTGASVNNCNVGGNLTFNF